MIRGTSDAQYRYTVGLAPLYRAPRKYYVREKVCCYPSRLVLVPSRLVSRLSLARARALSLSLSFRLSRLRDISERRARHGERDRLCCFFLLFSPILVSPPLISDCDSGLGSWVNVRAIVKNNPPRYVFVAVPPRVSLDPRLFSRRR